MIVVLGPARSGKTTLLKQIAKKSGIKWESKYRGAGKHDAPILADDIFGHPSNSDRCREAFQDPMVYAVSMNYLDNSFSKEDFLEFKKEKAPIGLKLLLYVGEYKKIQYQPQRLGKTILSAVSYLYDQGIPLEKIKEAFELVDMEIEENINRNFSVEEMERVKEKLKG